jgi:hypothetical protein
MYEAIVPAGKIPSEYEGCLCKDCLQYYAGDVKSVIADILGRSKEYK